MSSRSFESPFARPRPRVVICTVTLLLCVQIVAYAAGGVLDATFGAGGVSLVNTTGSTPMTNDSDNVTGLAVQPDGMIVAVGDQGNAASGTGIDFRLVRYTADGSLDATFGTGGIATLAYSANSEHAYDVAIQPDGKIVAAGYTSGGMLAARVNPNGTLDTTFGAGGYVFVPGPAAYAVALQSDGKILLAGDWNGKFAVARLLPADGSFDTTFGTGGTVYATPSSQLSVTCSDVKLQTVSGEQRIVLAGQFRKGGGAGDFGLMRLRASGAVDTTFGSGGSVQTDVAGGADKIFSIAIDASNRIVAGGTAVSSSRPSTGNDFAVVRYTANGALDTTFGSGGKQRTDFNGADDSARALTIQSDGKIVLYGYANSGTSYDLALTRYTTAGALDIAFGSGGRVQLDVGGSSDYVYAGATQTVTNPDSTTRERLLVGGTSASSAGYNMLVAAYQE